MAKLTFWFEFASTYSYLSAMRIESACQDAGVDLIWQPFLLGPIFAAQGWTNSPFALYPAKGAYMWRDIEREAERQGVAYSKPSLFPQNGLTAARIALAHQGQPWVPGFVRAVFTANFAEGRDISDKSVLSNILSDLAVDPAVAMEAAHTAKNKTALKSATELAAKIGIFGAPSFVVKDDIFWGNDRLDAALEFATKHA